MTDALLEAITVSKRYGGFESLSEVSIRATAGHVRACSGTTAPESPPSSRFCPAYTGRIAASFA